MNLALFFVGLVVISINLLLIPPSSQIMGIRWAFRHREKTPQKNEQLQLTVWWPISADQPYIWCCVRCDSEDGEEHPQPI